jgi:hypothetical protein
MIGRADPQNKMRNYILATEGAASTVIPQKNKKTLLGHPTLSKK